MKSEMPTLLLNDSQKTPQPPGFMRVSERLAHIGYTYIHADDRFSLELACYRRDRCSPSWRGDTLAR
jgi:hypothetical protein